MVLYYIRKYLDSNIKNKPSKFITTLNYEELDDIATKATDINSNPVADVGMENNTDDAEGTMSFHVFSSNLIDLSIFELPCKVAIQLTLYFNQCIGIASPNSTKSLSMKLKSSYDDSSTQDETTSNDGIVKKLAQKISTQVKTLPTRQITSTSFIVLLLPSLLFYVIHIDSLKVVGT